MQDSVNRGGRHLRYVPNASTGPIVTFLMTSINAEANFLAAAAGAAGGKLGHGGVGEGKKGHQREHQECFTHNWNLLR